MARIVIVYNTERDVTRLMDMAHIRWHKVAEALARAGHQVDLATAEHRWHLRKPTIPMGTNLRRVPLSRVDWDAYDVVKTEFHQGFRTLLRYGGGDHPFIISKLGSVVGPREMGGIYFYGRHRRRMYATQVAIHQTSRYVAVLSQPARDLWFESHGPRDGILIVPGAVDAEVPAPGRDPFPDDGKIRSVFAGNVYDRRSQPEANRSLIEKLNELGSRLLELGGRLYLLGRGDVRRLDRRVVTYLGAVPYGASWDFLHFADAGVVVSAGAFMHNNESTKIYHYLRVGLPVVCEGGFPNDHVVQDAQLGWVLDAGDLEGMAQRVVEAPRTRWDRQRAIQYILDHHTWDRRVEAYDRIIRQEVPNGSGAP